MGELLKKKNSYAVAALQLLKKKSAVHAVYQVPGGSIYARVEKVIGIAVLSL